jgi:hypothetical protein
MLRGDLLLSALFPIPLARDTDNRGAFRADVGAKSVSARLVWSKLCRK